MGIVLTTPFITDAAGGYDEVTVGSVAIGNTDVVDTVTAASLIKTIRWVVEITDNINEKINSYEILAINHFGNDVSHNRYGIVGQRIVHAVNVVLNGADMELRITNNETVSIEYKVARLEII